MEQCVFCGKDCRGGINGISNHIRDKHPERILPGEPVIMGPDFRYMPKSMSDSFDDIIHDDDSPIVKAGKIRREKQRRIKYARHQAQLKSRKLTSCAVGWGLDDHWDILGD